MTDQPTNDLRTELYAKIAEEALNYKKAVLAERKAQDQGGQLDLLHDASLETEDAEHELFHWLDELEALNFRETQLADPTATYTPRQCRSCGALIAFATTVKGAKMPVDLNTCTGEPIANHYTTCPQAAAWSKK